jgi:hypothetical protein
LETEVPAVPRRLLPILACSALVAGCGGVDESAMPTATPTPATQIGGPATVRFAACLTKAGATQATGRGDLAFARGTAVGHGVRSDKVGIAGGAAVYSFKPTARRGAGWRIYLAIPDQRDSGVEFRRIVADPGRAIVAAYVRPATRRAVRRADACIMDA